MTKYYTLLAQHEDNRWSIEFGDYSRKVVVAEMNDRKDTDSYTDYQYRYKIIETTDTQADIDAAVSVLNKG